MLDNVQLNVAGSTKDVLTILVQNLQYSLNLAQLVFHLCIELEADPNTGDDVKTKTVLQQGLVFIYGV